MSQGFLAFAALGKESNWGTAVSATEFLEFFSESIAEQLDRYDVKNASGVFAEPDDVAGLLRVQGDLVMAAHPVTMGHFLKAALQNTSGTVVVSGALYTTKFFSTRSEFALGVPRQPYTLVVFRDVGSAHQYAGALCSRLTLGLGVSQDLRMSSTWIAKDTGLITKPSPTFPTSPSEPFTFDTASLSLGGATTRIEAIEWTIDNQFEGIGAMNGSRFIAKVRARGPQMVRVSGTLDFLDVAEYLDFKNQTERPLIVTMTKANSFQLVLECPRFVYETFPMAVGGRERVTTRFTGRARYHVGSGMAFAATLTSTRSDY